MVITCLSFRKQTSIIYLLDVFSCGIQRSRRLASFSSRIHFGDSQVDASSVETKQEADARIARGIEATTKGRDFWLSFAAMIVSIFLSALDLTSIGTALPTIADALNDTKGDFTWVCVRQFTVQLVSNISRLVTPMPCPVRL